jgi:Fic family protein
LYTETDDLDATYFILYHLGVIRRAIEEMRKYLGHKAKELREFRNLIQRSSKFNYRQIALLLNAVSRPGEACTYKGHATTHRVTRQSARTDLLDLRRRGLLDMHREGQEFVFTPVPGLAKKLAEGTESDAAGDASQSL